MLLGVLGEGETPSADQLRDGIDALKDLLASWGTEGFVVPSRVREEFALVAGQASYTVGAAGTFNTARPVEIEAASIKDENSNPAAETPLEVITLAEWAGIPLKEMTGQPTKIYRQGTFPLETIYLYPVPDAAKKLVLYSRKALLSIANANTTLDLPDGYARAIRYNLAVELAPEYSKPVPNEVAAIAVESKTNIVRLNGEPSYLEVDRMFVGGRVFNMVTGE